MVVVGGVPLVVLGLVCRSRRAMAWVASSWARGALAICGVRLTIHGAEVLPDGPASFLLGNHQSALDIPILIAAMRGDVRFMAKNSLFRFPIFGWVLSMYGYIPIDRKRTRVTLDRLHRMYDRVERDPISLVAFPEGTRSRDGRLLPFRKGTMKICHRIGLPVVPFAIEGSHRVTPRKRIHAKPGPVRLTFGERIGAATVAQMSSEALHDRIRGAIADMLDRTEEIETPRAASVTAAEGR
jgi:1-acyl-sn-glycerol-3-phosphate acyltransferase